MRFRSIDALRGFAAIAVLLYHVWNRFYPGASTQHLNFTIPDSTAGHVTFFLFGFGWFGVNLFFVLSGFCIHLPQALKFCSTSSDRLRLGNFAKRRFFRLYPAYFASLVWTSLVLLILPLLASLTQHTAFHFTSAAHLNSFLVNALFLQQLFPQALDFNGVYWTLLFEVQFYLFYPLLLMCCRRTSFAVVGGVLLAAELLFLRFPGPVADLFLSRYFEWFLGVLLAERVAQRKPLRFTGSASAALFTLGVLSVFHPLTHPLCDLLVSLSFAALLARLVLHENADSWMQNSSMVFIGVFSYSLYLVHVPMIDLCWNSLNVARKHSVALPQWLALVSIPLSIALGYACFLCFERPFLGKPGVKAPTLTTGAQERAW